MAGIMEMKGQERGGMGKEVRKKGKNK